MFRVISTNGLSDRIEQFILNELRQRGERVIVIRRKDVAEKLECAPSQVTYVVNTRFTPREGFYVESRRGTNGFIRIAVIDQNQQTEEEKASAKNPSPRAATPTPGVSSEAPSRIDPRVDAYCQKLLASGMVTMRECLLLRNVMQIMVAAVPTENREPLVNVAFARVLQILREGK